MSTTKDTMSTEPALIVFGTPKGARSPHAAWFRAAYVNRVSVAAQRQGLATIAVETDATRAAAATLKEGQLKAGGQLVMPCVTQEMLNRLNGLVPKPRPSPAEGPVSPATAGVQVPVSVWDKLKPTDLVLAADLDKAGEPNGWYEANIMKIEDGIYTVRWYHEYEGEPRIVRRERQHIALMYPG
jgi:hypothetical protein